MQIFGLGTPEIILIVVVLLLFFGKDRLPDLARSVGRSVTELKRGFTDGWKEDGEKSATTNDVGGTPSTKGKK
ncbi:MAG: twin-arginine translocase TatA/TatE family subunit [Polyangiaceae bacterium]|jgi:sec-independent protein translocase protein TatA|nr:twin-arginine translocase TatA/TatE family subunit [Polyangiaceae bacterium]